MSLALKPIYLAVLHLPNVRLRPCQEKPRFCEPEKQLQDKVTKYIYPAHRAEKPLPKIKISRKSSKKLHSFTNFCRLLMVNKIKSVGCLKILH